MAHPEAEAQIVIARIRGLANDMPRDKGAMVPLDDIGVSDDVIKIVIAALDKDGIKAESTGRTLRFEWK